MKKCLMVLQVIAMLVVFQATIYAASPSVHVTGCYTAFEEDDEPFATSVNRARADAKRLAAEQLAVVVQSTTIVSSGIAMKDEAVTIAYGLISFTNEQVRTEVGSDGTINFYASYDAQLLDLDKRITELLQDRTRFYELVKQNKELQDSYNKISEENQQLLARLKSRNAMSEVQIQQIIELRKKNAKKFEAWLLIIDGDKNFLASRFDAAEAAYRKAIDVAPEYNEGYRQLGQCLLIKNRMQEAFPFIQKAIQLNPEDGYGYGVLGIYYSQMHDIKDAIDCYRKCLDLKPYDFTITLNLANMLMQNKQYGEVEKILYKFLQLNNDPGVYPYQILGKALFCQEKYTEAIDVFQKVIAMNPRFIEAYGELSLCYMSIWQYQEGLNVAKKHMQLAPEDAIAYLNAGDCARELGWKAEAIQYYKKALSLKPADKYAAKMLQSME